MNEKREPHRTGIMHVHGALVKYVLNSLSRSVHTL